MKVNPYSFRVVLALCVSVACCHARADARTPAVTAISPVAESPQIRLSQGTVVSVNTEAGKVVLRHGPLENLDMPAMTMGFQVPDKASLAEIHVGDKLVFRAEMRQGALMATAISLAPEPSPK